MDFIPSKQGPAAVSTPELMELKHLLEAILTVSEKAAILARAIRSEHSLFELLIQEKSGETKNKRFVHDFKTLADVLVQELVKYDLSRKFPGIQKNIFGEESSTFTNTLGESVTVVIKENAEEMTELLSVVLDGNVQAASLLTKVIHGSEREDGLRIPDQELFRVPDQLCTEVSNIGLWIDPIDSTAQYIHGYQSEVSACGVYTEGLQCAVILIGVYNTTTGEPILGVANQPFCTQTDKQWSGRTVWGLSFQDIQVSSICPSHTTADRSSAVVQSVNDQGIQCSDNSKCRRRESVILSTSEEPSLLRRLEATFDLVHAAGAGYKQLCVIDSLVAAYVLSKGSTFKWDTCAPHAILKSLGGGIVDFDKALELVQRLKRGKASSEADLVGGMRGAELLYHKPDKEGLDEGERWSNTGGIIAYTQPGVLWDIAKV